MNNKFNGSREAAAAASSVAEITMKRWNGC
jgi:hypothetical protein